MINWLEDKSLPTNDNLAKSILRSAHEFGLVGDHRVLVRTVNDPEKPVVHVRRVVPESLYRSVLSLYHDSVWSGAHMGREKTFNRINRDFFWYGMRKYISLYVKTCKVCQLYKKNPKHDKTGFTSKSKLGHLDAEYFWDMVSIDIWGPVQSSKRGNRYLLTMVDGYTKFSIVIPLSSITAEAVVYALRSEVFKYFGIPRRLHSDNGPQFVSEVLAEMCRFYTVDKTFTTPYHPQSNSYVERIHFFWRNAIATFIRGDQLIWDEMIPELQLCYNNAFSEATGIAPNEAVFGYLMRTVGSPDNIQPKMQLTPMQSVERIRYILNRAHYLINEGIVKKLQRNELRSAGVETTVFQVGQKVKLFAPKRIDGDSVKLSQGFYGPYEVIRSTHDHKVYYLKDLFGTQLKFPVSVLRLEPWHDREYQMRGVMRLKDMELDKDDAHVPFESDSDEEIFEDKPPAYIKDMNSPWDDIRADFTLEEEPVESEAIQKIITDNNSVM